MLQCPHLRFPAHGACLRTHLPWKCWGTFPGRHITEQVHARDDTQKKSDIRTTVGDGVRGTCFGQCKCPTDTAPGQLACPQSSRIGVRLSGQWASTKTLTNAHGIVRTSPGSRVSQPASPVPVPALLTVSLLGLWPGPLARQLLLFRTGCINMLTYLHIIR